MKTLGDPPATSTVSSSGPAAPSAAGPKRTATRAQRLAWLRAGGPTVALVVLCVVFTLITPGFGTWRNATNMLDSGAVSLILAVGTTFVILQGGIDLSIEGLVAVAAVAAAVFLGQHELGVVGILAAIAIAGACGVANGLIVTKLRIPSLMATLGMWFISLGVATVLFGGQETVIHDRWFQSLAVGKTLGITHATLFAVAVILVGVVVQTRTRFGRYSSAIGEDESRVRLTGVRVDRYKVGAFALMGLLAGLAGILFAARLGTGTPESGSGLLFATIAAVVIGGTLLSGGKGGVAHSTVGVLILVTIQNEMVLAGVDQSMQEALQGAIIIIVIAAASWPNRHRLQVAK